MPADPQARRRGLSGSFARTAGGRKTPAGARVQPPQAGLAAAAADERASCRAAWIPGALHNAATSPIARPARPEASALGRKAEGACRAAEARPVASGLDPGHEAPAIRAREPRVAAVASVVLPPHGGGARRQEPSLLRVRRAESIPLDPGRLPGEARPRLTGEDRIHDGRTGPTASASDVVDGVRPPDRLPRRLGWHGGRPLWMSAVGSGSPCRSGIRGCRRDRPTPSGDAPRLRPSEMGEGRQDEGALDAAGPRPDTGCEEPARTASGEPDLDEPGAEAEHRWSGHRRLARRPPAAAASVGHKGVPAASAAPADAIPEPGRRTGLRMSAPALRGHDPGRPREPSLLCRSGSVGVLPPAR